MKKHLTLYIAFAFIWSLLMNSYANEKVIRAEVTVSANIEAVWEAWTTSAGVKSFFAPDCNVELKIDGAYEIFFDPSAAPSFKGAEDMRILAFQKPLMLSFTWSAPPYLPNVRKQRTHVLIRFEEINVAATKVILTHDGWGEGDEWNEAFKYFEAAWAKVVLPRLKHRFDAGPVDWNNPPSFK